MSEKSQEDIIEAYVRRVYARKIECAYNYGLRDGMDAVTREIKETNNDLPAWWPKYLTGKPIMPGDYVAHPDMYGVREVTGVVYGIHGMSVRCGRDFETMDTELFTRRTERRG